jgi:hypothetical protein
VIARTLYLLWAFIVASARFWELLDRTGIAVFVGPNGSGKSLVMVQAQAKALTGMEWSCWDAEHRHHKPFREHAADCGVCDLGTFLPFAVESDADLARLLDDGVVCGVGSSLLVQSSRGTRRIYSTVPLTESKGVPNPLYVPLTDYRQLLTIEHADVLFDEVAGIADASASSSMPVQVVNWQHKLRKADIRQRTTTPAYARCALPIRQVAQVVVECRSFFPARRNGVLWRPRRLVLATAYDAWAFDDFTASEGQRTKLKAQARALLWVPDAPAIGWYNSFGQVLSLGHITEGGMCISCGGGRSRPSCACEHDHSDAGPGELEVVTITTPGGARKRKAIRVGESA